MRATNDDSWCADDSVGLYAVADGMGGYDGGALASRLVITKLYEYINAYVAAYKNTGARGTTLGNAPLVEGIEAAQAAVCAYGYGNRAEMGSTLTALWTEGQSALIANVGDSRIYRLRDGRFQQMTSDHSLFVELCRDGKLTAADRETFAGRNVITRAIGRATYKPDITQTRLHPRDRFLLCSDGLYERIKVEELAMLVSSGTPGESSYALVNLAVYRGTHDNMSAVVVDVEEA